MNYFNKVGLCGLLSSRPKDDFEITTFRRNLIRRLKKQKDFD